MTNHSRDELLDKPLIELSAKYHWRIEELADVQAYCSSQIVAELERLKPKRHEHKDWQDPNIKQIDFHFVEGWNKCIDIFDERLATLKAEGVAGE